MYGIVEKTAITGLMKLFKKGKLYYLIMAVNMTQDVIDRLLQKRPVISRH